MATLTQERLKQIIVEELRKILKEEAIEEDPVYDAFRRKNDGVIGVSDNSATFKNMVTVSIGNKGSTMTFTTQLIKNSDNTYTITAKYQKDEKTLKKDNPDEIIKYINNRQLGGFNEDIKAMGKEIYSGTYRPSAPSAPSGEYSSQQMASYKSSQAAGPGTDRYNVGARRGYYQ